MVDTFFQPGPNCITIKHEPCKKALPIEVLQEATGYHVHKNVRTSALNQASKTLSYPKEGKRVKILFVPNANEALGSDIQGKFAPAATEAFSLIAQIPRVLQVVPGMVVPGLLENGNPLVIYFIRKKRELVIQSTEIGNFAPHWPALYVMN